jgi:hypothetical protein
MGVVLIWVGLGWRFLPCPAQDVLADFARMAGLRAPHDLQFPCQTANPNQYCKHVFHAKEIDMATDWGAIEDSFKKLQPKIKAIDPAPVENLIKQIKAALKTLWAGEDVFAKAIKTADEGGIKGSKPADFAGDKAVMAALKVLHKAGGVHEALVADLRKRSTAAIAPKKEFDKLLGAAKKQIDKKNKAQVKFQAEMKSDYARVCVVADAMGKLTAAETFYGARIDKVVDRIINKTKPAGKSAPSGSPEALIEQKERDKNAKQAVKLAGNVAKLCEGAVKKADPDPKAAAPYLKKAAELIKDLKDLNTAYQTLKKKNAKLIKASKDKAKIVRVIATIAKAHDLSASRYSEAQAKVKEITP